MISDYNNVIVDKLVEYIEAIVEKINLTANDSKIEINHYEMANDADLDVNYLTSHNMTGEFTVKIFFDITQGGKKHSVNDDLNIPKMVNNVFVIEGAMRVPTNTLQNDSVMMIYTENVRVNQNLNIKYEEDPHEPGGYKLTVEYFDDTWTPVVLDFSEENFKKYHEYFILSDDEIDKIKIKLDTDDVNRYFTRDVAIRLIKLGPDKLVDRMIDKKIFSPEANFMHYMWSKEVRRKVLSSMRSKFYQYGNVYLRDIQNFITRYFKIANEQNIDIPSTVNPLVFDAMRYKIKIGKYTAYNKSMSDIIDVVNTPINQHINQINEMNICAEIDNDDLYIHCYEFPSGKPIKVKYLHYCTKKVVFNDDWDYDKNSFTNPKNPVHYSLRCIDRVGKSSDQYDYIEPKADDKLSITTRRIPLGNKSDSVRMHMGTGMMKQALEIPNSEPPLITAGYDDQDYELSTLVSKYKGKPGIVTKIEDNKIYVKDDKSKSVQYYEIPEPSKGQHDSIISFTTTLKVGDKLKGGEVMMEPYVLRRHRFELGLNVRCIYMNYLGFTHEDGNVISESLAKRMMHYSLLDVVMPLYPDDVISYIRPVGSRVKFKDVLVNRQSRVRVSKSIEDVYVKDNGLLQGMGIDFKQEDMVVPNSFMDGYVLNVNIHIEPGRELTNQKSVGIINDFKKVKNVPEDNGFKDIPEKFKSLKAIDIDMNDRICGYITYKLLRIDVAKIGDKICNRYGGKGIITLVLPDNLMPRIERDGKQTPAELLLTPASVLKRKNISQIYETQLAKIVRAVYAKVEPLIKEGKFTEARKLLDRYYKGQFKNDTDSDLLNKVEKLGINGFSMKTGFFSKIEADEILQWMKELGVSDTERIFIPDVVIAETKDGMKGFPLSGYTPQPDHTNIRKFELGYCEQKAETGDIYMMKLFHNANYSAKANSSVIDTEEPIMGQGNYRDADGYGGQKIGEMDLWVLMGSKLEKFVQSQAPDMVDSQYAFLNEMLLAGYTISDPNGNPYLTRQRSRNLALEKLGK